jgi:transcriptional regulator with XRE-family HTH domain
MPPDPPIVLGSMPPKPLSLDEIARSQIRRWMEAMGRSQAAIGEAIGRNQVWMSRYLNGKVDADLTTLQQMATIFDHTIAALFSVPQDPDEATLIKNFRAARPEARKTLLEVADAMSRPARVRGRSRK